MKKVFIILIIILLPATLLRINVAPGVNIKFAEILLIPYFVFLVYCMLLAQEIKFCGIISIPIILFLCGLTISSLVTIDLKSTFVYNLTILIDIMIVIVIYNYITDSKSLIFIVNLFILSALVTCILGISSYLLPDNLFFEKLSIGSSYGRKVESYVGDPNRFASFINMALSISFARYLFGNKRLSKYFFIFSVIFLVGITLSGSRAAIIISYLTCVSQLLAYLILKGKENVVWITKIRRIILIIPIIMLLGFLLFRPHGSEFSIYDRFKSPNQSEGEIGFSNIRFEFWRQGIESFLRHPLTGTGPFTFELGKSTDIHGRDSSFSSHNLYVEILSTGGLVSFIPFIIILLFLLLSAERGIIRFYAGENSELLSISVGLFFGFLGFLIHAIVITLFNERYVWLFFALIVSIDYVKSHLNQDNFDRVPENFKERNRFDQ